ncbi:hypothetical protein MXB_1309, partial [Myxobolus squamalis]
MLGYFTIILSLSLLSFRTKQSCISKNATLAIFEYKGMPLIISAPCCSEICINYNLSNIEGFSFPVILWIKGKSLNLKLVELVNQTNFKIHYNEKNSTINVSSKEICLKNLTEEYNNSEISWEFKAGRFNFRKKKMVIAMMMVEEIGIPTDAKDEDLVNKGKKN